MDSDQTVNLLALILLDKTWVRLLCVVIVALATIGGDAQPGF